MHLANSTITVFKKATLFIIISFSYSFAMAQENSPYTRYGIGDIVPSQNMVSRAMGGISAGFVDGTTFFQSINLSNPASLANINSTTFDVGGEVDVRTLKSNSSPTKYKSVNTLISYLQLGFPITPSRMRAKGNSWGVSVGLRPLTRINYKIEENKRLTNIDSINSLYEGSGGISQANISTGIKIKNFSFGLSTGYTFGNRNVSTQLKFLNDSTQYKGSNTEANARFGSVFLNLGAQYAFNINKKNTLRIGATANLQQKLKATRSDINETTDYAPDGTVFSIDTVTFNKEEDGTIVLPASYSIGFTITNPHWIVGADIDFANWQSYSYYGKKDPLQNSAKFHAGAQFFPASETTPASKKLMFVKYRAGFYYGNDYVKLNTTRPDYGFTLGAGIPLTNSQRWRFGEFVTLNTGVEIGQRGNKSNVSIRENIFRINFGLSMSASWFQKRKYD
jgi:hypothetical protein